MRFLRFGLLVLAAVTTVTCGGDKLTLPNEGNPSSAQVEQGNNQTGTVAQPLRDSLIIRLTDSKSRPVSGQRVAFVLTGGASGAAVAPDTAISDDAGRVRARWILGTVAGPQTLEARVIGFSSLTKTFTAQAAPAAADTLRLIQGDGQSGTVGATLTDSLVVRVTDRFGNGVSGVNVSWTVTGGGSISPSSTATDATGRAAVARTLGSSAGAQTTLATVAGLKGSPVTFTQTAGSGSASSLTIVSGDNQSGPASFPLGMPVVVKLADATGNGVPGVNVTWVIATGGGSVSPTTGTTDQNGLASSNWTLGPVAGANTLNAVSSGFTVNFSATATAAAPTQMAANSVTNQTGTAGLAVATSPSVRVRDANGNGVAGVGVTFAVAGGGGSVSDTTVGTGASGIATLPTWTLGQVAGTNQLTASVSGLTGSPVTFNATGNAGPAAQMVMQTQPPVLMTSGATITPTPAVQLQDQFGNTVTTQNVSVTVSLNGAGTLAGTKTRTSNSNGQASFPSLSLSGPPGSYSLSFTASGITGVTSTPISLGAGNATTLVFTTQPSNTTAGVAMTPAVVVQARDASNNVDPAFTGSVSLNLGANPGGDPLGTVSATAVSGVATFSGITLQKAAAGYTLVASSSGLSSATSNTFTVSPAAAASLAFSQQPTNVVAGATITPFVRVTALDAFGNAVMSPSIPIAIAIGTNPASGVLSGTSPRSTSGGIATFNNLSIDKAGTGYTLVASGGGFNVTSNPFDVTVGNGSKVAFVAPQPTSATAGAAITPGFTVEVQDAAGNRIPGANNQITVFIGTNPSQGSLSGTTQRNAVNGTVTFTGLSIDSAGTGYTLTASASGLVSTSSSSFDIVPGSPSASLSTVTASPGTISASNGSSSSTITVTVKDQKGNLVPGTSVTLGVTGGSGNTLSASGPTNSSGVYTGTFSATVSGATRTISATAGAVLLNQTASVFVNPGLPSQLTVSQQPGSVQAGQTILPAPAFTIRDALGNQVTSATNTVTVGIGTNAGSGTLLGNVTATASGGVATFTNLSIDKVGTGYTLVGTASGLSSATTGTFDITPGSPSASQSTVSAPSPIVASGGSSTSTITVVVVDGSGNAVPGATVVLSASGTGNTLSASGPTDAQGTYTGTLSSTVAGVKTVSATANGVGITQTAAVTVNPAPATQLTVSQQPPGTLPAGQAITPAPAFTIRDGFGNQVTSATNMVAIGIGTNPGGGTLSGTTTVSASGGVATFPGLSIDQAGTGYTLQAVAAGLTSATTATFDITAGSAVASQSTATVLPASAAAGTAVNITVQARDALGNPVTSGGATVAVSVAGANPGSLTVTDPNDGTYTASYTPTVAGGDNLTITLNGGGISGSPYAHTVTAAALSPSNSTASFNPPSPTAGQQVDITVQSRDQYGNLVTTPGATVVINVTGANTATPPVTDVGNGTYTASYTPTSSGTDNIAITMNGTPISGSPFGQPVATGPASGAQSVGSAPGLGAAGSSVAIQVQARDAFGNPVTVGGATVAVSVTGANTSSPGVTDNNDGTYAASYVPASTGTDNAAVTLNGAAVQGSPFMIAIAAGGPSPPNTVATVPPGTAGAPTAITVQARDAQNNDLTTGGATILVTVSGANSASPSVTDHNDGTYTASYTPTSAGSDNIAITLSGTAIGSSPFTSSVSPGAPSAAQSLATVPPSGTAGSATAISVQARDQYGNPVTTGGAVVAVSVTGANTATPPVTDQGNGTYTASYTPAATGTDNIAITLGGSPVGASPYSSTVGAGAPSAAQSTATVPGGVAGVATTVTVQAKDAAGNDLTTGGAAVVVTVSGANAAGPTGATDQGDGTYTFQYTPTASGTDNVGITLNGGTVGASPYTSTVSPGPPSAGNSVAVVPGAGTAGAATVISVQARDQYGNDLSAGGAAVVVTVTGANSATPAVTDNGDGTYATSYTPTASGADAVAITLNGSAVGTSPYATLVAPGAASAAQTTAVVPSGNTGLPTSIMVQAQDQFGNLLTAGGDLVTVDVSGTNPAGSLTVTDNGDGTYSASYTPGTAGSDTVDIAINGTAIAGSPYASTVN